MLRRTFRFYAPVVINMPALSPTMEKGTITSWEKKVGDLVASDELLARVQTDKAVVDFNFVGDEFYLARILQPDGSKVTVGDPVALAVENKDELNSDAVKNWTGAGAAAASASTPAAAAAPAAAEAAAEPKSAAAAAATGASSSSSGKIFASPLARITAEKLGIPLSSVTGTGGASGRITKDDVIFASTQAATITSKVAPSQAAAVAEKAATTKPKVVVSAVSGAAGAAFEDIAVTPMRGIIASRLLQSKTELPHYYLMQEYRADNMLTLLKQLNAKGAGNYKISVNDYIIKCIARANLLAPECNTHWHGDFMRRYNTVDVSVAVATETGLITPIVKNAHIKGLVQISQETKALAKKARDGELKPEEYQGGTISVSNLGAMGVDCFTAIINPPQSTILAVGQTRPRPAFNKTEEGTFVATGAVETVVSFTASFDHRVVDGAVGAKWFKHFGDAFENPLSLLL